MSTISEQDLQKMLSIMSRQSERISQMKDTIDRLTADLQEKDSQRSEALTIAEMLQAELKVMKSVQKENELLRGKVMESNTRIEVMRKDFQKQIELIKGKPTY